LTSLDAVEHWQAGKSPPWVQLRDFGLVSFPPSEVPSERCQQRYTQ
jgi:hypothetical protein